MDNVIGNTNSFMDLRFTADGKKTKQLKIPTYYNEAKKLWTGAIQLPKSLKLISAIGSDSSQLEQNFNNAVEHFLQNHDLADELFEMFQEID